MEARHPTPEAASQNNPQARRPRPFWPESWEDGPYKREFPFKLLLWALPGIAAAALLFFLIGILYNQANKRIVYMAPTGELAALRANSNPTNDMSNGWLRLNEAGRQKLLAQTGIPALGYAQSSPNRRHLATTIENADAIAVTIFSPITNSITTLPSNGMMVPHNGWSADSRTLALLQYDGSKPSLSLVDMTTEERALNRLSSLAIDSRVGLDWHPDEAKLLVTHFRTVDRPALAIIEPDGEWEPFTPIGDNQSERADAIWSPSGTQVAYIGVRVNISTADFMVPAGSLWVAQEDGTSARELVNTGNNFAPVWHERDPNYIYFASEITSTVRLRRVNVSGVPLVEDFGAVATEFLSFPFDRELFVGYDSSENPPVQISATPADPSIHQSFKPNQMLRTLLWHAGLPLLGGPQWSPDGSRLAATIWQNGSIQTAVYGNNLQAIPSLVPLQRADTLAVPSDGWSSDSNHLALLAQINGQPTLQMLVNGTSTVAFPDVVVDTRAGLSWNPVSNDLLITAVSPDTELPTLQFAALDGRTGAFQPADDQLIHADAAYAPDGARVAYIASNSYSPDQDILFGDLWLSDSVGSIAQKLTNIGNAFAPIWSPNGDAIFFTRLDPATGQFELYRMPFNEDGTIGPELYIGPSSEAFLRYPFDRSHLLQWSPDGAELLLLASEFTQPAGYQRQLGLGAQIQAQLPLVGAIRWSADRRRFATSEQQPGGRIVTVVYDSASDSERVTTLTETHKLTIVPADGWSPLDTYIALIRQNEADEIQLGFLNPANRDIKTANVILDTRAGLSWEQNERFVLVTGLQEGITPTLYAVSPLSSIVAEPFIPDDDQAVHSDAALSPDGEHVAYIASDDVAATQEAQLLTGSVWLADADGQNPRRIVAQGQNFAPIWLNDTELVFTRLLPDTDSYRLFHVEFDNGLVTITERGPSTAAFANYPFDRQLFMTWTENGRRWNLNDEPTFQRQVVYKANADGTELALLEDEGQCPETTLPFTVRWAATSRAMLVACPAGSMWLHWLDSNRDNDLLVRGAFPTWEP